MRPNRFVVTGAARSGTGSIAATLNRWGIACSHEQVFTEDVAAGSVDVVDWGAWDGESSWLAAPFLPLVGIHVVHLIREPEASVRSIVGSGMFAGSELDYYGRVVARHMPSVYREATEQDRALSYWCRWNSLIASHTDARLVIDTATPKGLAAALHIERGDKGDIEHVNTSADKDARPVPDDLWESTRPALRAFARVLWEGLR